MGQAPGSLVVISPTSGCRQLGQLWAGHEVRWLGPSLREVMGTWVGNEMGLEQVLGDLPPLCPK